MILAVGKGILRSIFHFSCSFLIAKLEKNQKETRRGTAATPAKKPDLTDIHIAIL